MIIAFSLKKKVSQLHVMERLKILFCFQSQPSLDADLQAGTDGHRGSAYSLVMGSRPTLSQ